MESTCKISVIIPVYNALPYLSECVESVLEQSFPDFELILADDGSQDGSGALCDELAKKDARIRVIHKKNGGANSARNAGLKIATGTYVCYVDCDDYIAGDMLEKLYTFAVTEHLDMAVADLVCFDGDRKWSNPQHIKDGVLAGEELKTEFFPKMLFLEDFRFGAMPTLCSKLFKRELLQKNQFQVDERIWMGEDGAITYPCYLDSERVGYLKGRGYYFYRMNQNSQTHSRKKSYHTDKILILCRYLEKRFQEKEALFSVLEPQLYLYMFYLVDSMFRDHASLSLIWKNKAFFKEAEAILSDELGKKMVQYCSRRQTSSRGKRLLRMMQSPSLRNRLEYYLFLKYEKMM